MSRSVHNGFKPIIDCITVHNNLYNNDWNDTEYTLTLFANIFYYTVTFNTVTDHTPVPIYTLTLSASNLYHTCTCTHLDLLTCPPRSLYCCFRASICWLSFSGNSTCCFSAICRPVFITCSTSGFSSLIVR